jgi:hypothetical protein
MLDGQAYQAHFPDDPAYDRPLRSEPACPPQSAELIAALAALAHELGAILKAARVD